MDDTARRNTTTTMTSSKVPVRAKGSSGDHQSDHIFHAPTVRAAISTAQSRSVGRRRKDLFQASVRGTSRPSRAPQPTTATDPAVTATHTNTTVITIPVTKISVSGASVSVTVPSTSTGPIPGRSSATTRTAGASGTACAARSGHRRRK